jgi:predicted membrane protein
MIQKKLTRNNIILLICLLIFILLYPILSVHKKLAQNAIFTAIIIFGIFSLDFSEKTRRILMASGAITICLDWLYHFFSYKLFGLAFFFSFFSFNLFITVFMVRHVAISKKVTPTIILNSINGYLLIGILGAVLLAGIEILQKYVFQLDTGAINFSGMNAKGFHDYLYFSFVTMTTLGYGDITPVSSYAKSITLVVAIAGQLYLTILVAMLVGKYLSRSEKV